MFLILLALYPLHFLAPLLILLQSHWPPFCSTCLYHPRTLVLLGFSVCIISAWNALHVLSSLSCIRPQLKPHLFSDMFPGALLAKVVSSQHPVLHHTHTYTCTHMYSALPLSRLYFSLHLPLCLIIGLITCLPSKMLRSPKKVCATHHQLFNMSFGVWHIVATQWKFAELKGWGY